MIKTLTFDGLTSVTIKQSAYDMARFCWLYNHSESDIFASCVNSECTENADNVLRIPAGEPRMLDTESYETLYLNGSGTVELITSAYSVCPFNRAAKGGGASLSGSAAYTINNAVDYPLMGLNLYGKSVQDGMPTPENPVEIVSVGDSGTVNITANNGADVSVTAAITSALPLCGIPVSEGGNYTDSNGQQWICDYVDFDKGVKVQRVERFVANEFAEDYIDTVNNQMLCSAKLTNLPVKNDINTKINAISNKLEEKAPGKLYNEVGSAFCFISSGRVRVTLKGVTTTAELNATLGEVVFIYPLATQIETPLTEAELQDYRQLQTFNGITNISNDGGADMDVKYCTNKTLSEYVMPITTGLQSQINELKAAVLSLGGNV